MSEFTKGARTDQAARARSQLSSLKQKVASPLMPSRHIGLIRLKEWELEAGILDDIVQKSVFERWTRIEDEVEEELKTNLDYTWFPLSPDLGDLFSSCLRHSTVTWWSFDNKDTRSYLYLQDSLRVSILVLFARITRQSAMYNALTAWPDWAQTGRRSLFLKSTLDRRLDRKISIQGRFRVDSRVDA